MIHFNTNTQHCVLWESEHVCSPCCDRRRLVICAAYAEWKRSAFSNVRILVLLQNICIPVHRDWHWGEQQKNGCSRGTYFTQFKAPTDGLRHMSESRPAGLDARTRPSVTTCRPKANSEGWNRRRRWGPGTAINKKYWRRDTGVAVSREQWESFSTSKGKKMMKRTRV